MQKYWGLVLSLVMLGALALLECVSDIPRPVTYEFRAPRPVIITDYAGHAMEPFLSRDGNTLFFNSLNDGNDTSLYRAEKSGADTFRCEGRIGNVNGAPPHLDAVASMDGNGRYYFTSTRSYFTDYRTIYSGNYLNGEVDLPAAVEGNFYREEPGWLVMDVEISADGETLYGSLARFSGGSVPAESDLFLAHKNAGRFDLDSRSAEILNAINTPAGLEYAPSISGDGLELFFTRYDSGVGYPRIHVSRRASLDERFGAPLLVDAIVGFAEAPCLSSDGKNLYYHAQQNGVFVVRYVTRP